MRTSEVEILVVPGWLGAGPDHWQSRWEQKLSSARRVEQDDWLCPDKDKWVGKIIAAAATATKPVVFLAHSLGAIAVVHAGLKMPPGLVAGAFLVAAADVDNAHDWPPPEGPPWSVAESGFAPVPLSALPFPSTLVVSSDDPYCRPERARHFAAAWGSQVVEAGQLGHVNTATGHGPWPEGVLRFGTFLSGLKA
jgi:predicted alpha/beta hydrolase family esterase